MKTSRLFLRERIEEQMHNLLEQPLEDQLEFFGFTEREPLETQLDYIRKGLSNYRISFKMWDMVRLEDDQVIGALGYHSWYEKHRRAEIGYAVHEPYRRQGYMTEALQAVIDYGFNEMDLNRIEALVGPDNEASLKLVKDLGFQKEGYLKQHFNMDGVLVDSIFFALLRSDYRSDSPS